MAAAVHTVRRGAPSQRHAGRGATPARLPRPRQSGSCHTGSYFGTTDYRVSPCTTTCLFVRPAGFVGNCFKRTILRAASQPRARRKFLPGKPPQKGGAPVTLRRGRMDAKPPPRKPSRERDAVCGPIIIGPYGRSAGASKTVSHALAKRRAARRERGRRRKVASVRRTGGMAPAQAPGRYPASGDSKGGTPFGRGSAACETSGTFLVLFRSRKRTEKPKSR